MSKTNKWEGHRARKARAEWKRVVDAGGVVCCRCQKPILAGESWQVDHWPISREHGGTDTWPAHARCNLSAGGKRGAQIVNERKFKQKFSGAGSSAMNGTAVVDKSPAERGIRGL